MLLLSFSSVAPPTSQHSFPTRRSSDLLLKFADFVVTGAGETAFDVAEKFGFDELFGNGGAINFDGWAFVEVNRSEEHTSELQSRFDLVCRLLLEKKNL